MVSTNLGDVYGAGRTVRPGGPGEIAGMAATRPELAGLNRSGLSSFTLDDTFLPNYLAPLTAGENRSQAPTCYDAPTDSSRSYDCSGFMPFSVNTNDQTVRSCPIISAT